jgi:branched-chain amino acid transport system permease protein
MNIEYFLNLLMSGLTKGSIYALIALGYTMVYGIIKLINFAHGEIYMIGAFTALIFATFFTNLGLPGWAVFFLATFAAIASASGYGITMEKMAYRPLRNSPRLSALISAIGMSIFLQNYVLLIQTENFLAFPRLIPDFAFMEPLRGLMSSRQLVIFAVTALVMVGLWVLIKFTRIGKAMRATSQDTTMAKLLGINVDRVISFTFLVGSATAAIGGVLIATYSGQINYGIGFLAGIKAFVAAVLGGIGSVPGAVLGSFILGLSESFGTGYISSDYENVFAFIILILVLTIRPSGILGANEKQKV